MKEEIEKKVEQVIDKLMLFTGDSYFCGLQMDNYRMHTQESLMKLWKVQKLLVLRDIAVICDDYDLMQQIADAFEKPDLFSLFWKYFGQEDFSELRNWVENDPFLEMTDGDCFVSEFIKDLGISGKIDDLLKSGDLQKKCEAILVEADALTEEVLQCCIENGGTLSGEKKKEVLDGFIQGFLDMVRSYCKEEI